jgi:hypothetical protein
MQGGGAASHSCRATAPGAQGRAQITGEAPVRTAAKGRFKAPRSGGPSTTDTPSTSAKMSRRVSKSAEK